MLSFILLLPSQSITARNLDEFFAKRVGALKRQEAAGMEHLLKKRDKSVWTPEDQLKKIARVVREMEAQINMTLLRDIMPALREEGVYLLDYDELSRDERLEMREWFTDKVEPLLTTMVSGRPHLR